MRVLMLIATTFFLISCHSWQHDVMIDNIEYSKFRYTNIPPGNKFSYSIGLLKEPTRVDSILYKEYLHLYSNGKVSGGLLAEDTTIYSILLKEGS